MIQRRWSKAQIVQRIQARHRASLTLVGGENAFPLLFSAARRHFGSWHDALLAAGLQSTPRRKWSRAVLIEAIRARQRQGTLSHVWKDDKSLFAAGVRWFGNWQNALAAAGITHRQLGAGQKNALSMNFVAGIAKEYRMFAPRIRRLPAPPLDSLVVCCWPGKRRTLNQWAADGQSGVSYEPFRIATCGADPLTGWDLARFP